MYSELNFKKRKSKAEKVQVMERISKDESDIQNMTIKCLVNVPCTDIGWGNTTRTGD